MNTSEQQNPTLEQALADFRRGMEVRGQLNLRVAKRVTIMLRTGIVGMGLLTLILLVMLIAFNNKLVEMNEVLHTMNQKFSKMSGNMKDIQFVVEKMDANVRYMPVIVGETSRMTESVHFLRSDIESISASVQQMQGNMAGMTGNLDYMTNSFRGLDKSVQYIGLDVNKLSRPSKMFNKMVPFFPW